MSSVSRLKRKRQLRRRVFLVLVCSGVVVYNIISYNVSKSSLSEKNKIFVSTESEDNKTVSTNSEDIIPSNTEDEENDNAGSVVADKVDKSYFSDAIFIGDSRTEGFVLNTGVCNGYSIATKGLNVKSVFDKQCIKNGDTYITAIEAIRTSSFDKAYLMFGINETGWQYSNVFIDYYKKLIDEIKLCNPDAKIYVQAILPVSKEVSVSSQYITKTRIDEFNRLLMEMAEEENVYFLNVDESVADSEGYLPEAAASDGIHLNKEYCMKWLDYLCEHTNG